MKRIFVSHPLFSEGDPAENLCKVNTICQDILSQGHLPISPLHAFSFVTHETPDIRENILQWCRDQIDNHIDELWFYGVKGGCAMEIKRAEQNRIPVVDRRGE